MFNQTEVSISVETFCELVRIYFDTDDIENVFDIGSMDAIDAAAMKMHLEHSFPGRFPKAYAIEGHMENYQNMLPFCMRRGVVPIQAVVSDKEDYATFHKKNINGIHGIFDRGENYGTETETVITSRVDKICALLGVGKIDIAKIDVEGATYEVLVGFGDLLHQVKMFHLETESYPFFKGQKLHPEVVSLMQSSGFDCLKITRVEIDADRFQYDSVWINTRFSNVG